MAYLSMSRKNRYKRLRRLFRRYKLYIVSIVVIASIALLCFFVGNAQAGVAEAPSESRSISEESLLNLVATTSVATHEPKPMTTVSLEETEPCEIEIAREDVEMLAKLIWGEARGVHSTEQKAAVVWCVLNRVDSPLYPDSIEAVVTQKYQFSGYNESYVNNMSNCLHLWRPIDQIMPTPPSIMVGLKTEQSIGDVQKAIEEVYSYGLSKKNS